MSGAAVKPFRLTPRQKQAFAEVRQSGELIVIEDDWLIYTSETQRCALGVRGTDTDIKAVRSALVRLPPAEETAYRERRAAMARKHAHAACDLIVAGNYEEAITELRKAVSEILKPGESLELYGFKPTE